MQLSEQASLTNKKSLLIWVADPGGRVQEVWTLPIRPDTCLRLKFLHWQDCLSLFNWLIFLMKHALHFATKLNSRDIQKCNCFWVPSYDLFTSARKAVFPAPLVSGVHRLRNTWEVICPGRGGGSTWVNVPLASQSPYPIIVYFLANYRPHLSHFLENVIFVIPT